MSVKLEVLINKVNRKKVPDGYKKYRGILYPDDWKLQKLNEVIVKVGSKVDVQKSEIYKQIGIRSHGKGIFYKDGVTGEEIGDKTIYWVEPNCFIVNIVFAWEQAVANTTENEKGYVASHRFPMYKAKSELVDIEYVTYFFKTEAGVNLLNLASPGGAGRNRTLNQKEFLNLNIPLPPIKEQKQIVSYFKLLEKKIVLKKELGNIKKERKKWFVQNVLSEKIRVGNFHKKWELKKLEEVVYEHKEKDNGKCEVFSVTVNNGMVNQIKHLGKSYAASDTSNYSIVKPNDLVYTKSPTGRFPFGIIKQSLIEKDVIVSPLYGVFTPENRYIGRFIHHYFDIEDNTERFLKPLATKGAKNTLNISNKKFLSGLMRLPTNLDEIKIIVELMDMIDFEQELLKAELKILNDHFKVSKLLFISGLLRVK